MGSDEHITIITFLINVLLKDKTVFMISESLCIRKQLYNNKTKTQIVLNNIKYIIGRQEIAF